MATYVVKSWYASEKKDVNGNYVEILGRRPGIISWLLALVGIEPTISIHITDLEFELEKGSWSGRFFNSVPLNKISSIYYGYAKPWKAALAIFLFFAGISLVIPMRPPAKLIGLLIAFLIAFAYYFLNKILSLGVFEVSGRADGIKIKRSVIENKKLDEKDAEQVEKILKTLMANYNKTFDEGMEANVLSDNRPEAEGFGNDAPNQDMFDEESPKTDSISFTCPECAANIRTKDDKAGSKGRCPKCKATITVPEIS